MFSIGNLLVISMPTVSKYPQVTGLTPPVVQLYTGMLLLGCTAVFQPTARARLMATSTGIQSQRADRLETRAGQILEDLMLLVSLAVDTPLHSLPYSRNAAGGAVEVLHPAGQRLPPGCRHDAGPHYGDGQAAALTQQGHLS